MAVANRRRNGGWTGWRRVASHCAARTAVLGDRTAESRATALRCWWHPQCGVTPHCEHFLTTANTFFRLRDFYRSAILPPPHCGAVTTAVRCHHPSHRRCHPHCGGRGPQCGAESGTRGPHCGGRVRLRGLLLLRGLLPRPFLIAHSG